MSFKTTGFTEFITATIKILRKKNPELAIADAMKDIHREWTQLSPAQKEMWEQKAINKRK
jgi:hypothetical protein